LITQEAEPAQASPAEQPRESKVRRLSHEHELYTPKREAKIPSVLTVEQYLGRAKQEGAIADLIRSLHKKDIMSFSEWERKTALLLKKRIW
jgi:hypothetical protein